MSLSSFKILNYREFCEVSCKDIVKCIPNLSICVRVCNRYIYIYFLYVTEFNLVILVECHYFLRSVGHILEGDIITFFTYKPII